MDFTFDETQLQLAALVREIVTTQLTTQRRKAVEATQPHFDRALWKALADVDVVSAALPSSVGGTDFDFIEQCLILVELGRAVAPVPYLTSVVSAAAIAHFGTDAQRTDWATPAAAGSLVLTAALTEQLGGIEEFSTVAEPDGPDWVLTGAKAVVPFGTIADAFLVPATTPDGPALFLVLPADEGVSIVAERSLDDDEVASLTFGRVALPADRFVAGGDVVHWLVARTTIAACAYQLGVLERALELTADYAKTREQFGRPIGSFQAVAQRLADAYIDVEGVRLTMWEAAWRIASALSSPAEIATAKFWAAEAGHRVAHTAVHIHGGTGIDLDAETPRYFAAAKRTEFLLGGATAQLLRLGEHLDARTGDL